MEELTIIQADQYQVKFTGPSGNGSINWEIVYQNENGETDDTKDHFHIKGTGTTGVAIDTVVSLPKEQVNEVRNSDKTINPTKLFLLIAKVLTELLCPDCDPIH